MYDSIYNSAYDYTIYDIAFDFGLMDELSFGCDSLLPPGCGDKVGLERCEFCVESSGVGLRAVKFADDICFPATDPFVA